MDILYYIHYITIISNINIFDNIGSLYYYY